MLASSFTAIEFHLEDIPGNISNNCFAKHFFQPLLLPASGAFKKYHRNLKLYHRNLKLYHPDEEESSKYILNLTVSFA